MLESSAASTAAGNPQTLTLPELEQYLAKAADILRAVQRWEEARDDVEGRATDFGS